VRWPRLAERRFTAADIDAAVKVGEELGETRGYMVGFKAGVAWAEGLDAIRSVPPAVCAPHLTLVEDDPR
jgi:hypothetical protein